MGGLIIDGWGVRIDGVKVVDFFEEPELALRSDDGRRRTSSVTGIVLHTTGGRQSRIADGEGPSGHARSVIRYWRSDPRQSGAHIVVDHDGTVYCTADLAGFRAYHAGAVNDRSVGIEICQRTDGMVYTAALDATAAVVETICGEMGIPHHVHLGPPRDALAAGARYIPGIWGHVDCAGGARGAGDPGYEIKAWLLAREMEIMRYVDTGTYVVSGAGRFVGANFGSSAWRDRWQNWQARVGGLAVDGIPGPKTMEKWRKYRFSYTW